MGPLIFDYNKGLININLDHIKRISMSIKTFNLSFLKYCENNKDILFFQVRIVDEKESRSFSFEVYSDSNQLVKGCKTDSRGTVVQGRHKTYR